jgi:outer membrane protein
MIRTLRVSAVAALLTLSVTALAAGTAAAVDVRFGYIDSARIFRDFSEAKEAQERFDRQVQGWRTEAAEKERQVSDLRTEVQDQGPILSALKRQEKEAALQRAISEYERFIQDIWGPSGRAAAENGNMTSAIVEKIRSAVEKVAGDRALNLVLDSASGFLIYADPSFDLTDEVLAELAKQAGPGAG